jgi:hypothetical protein
MWGEIAALENLLQLAANNPEADEYREKINLLKGVLQWQLEREFSGRLWKIRRNLRQTGESLVETQRARRQIDETMRNEPVKFAEFSERVYGLSPRIDGMMLNVSDAMVAQGDLLRTIAVDELQAQKRRLDTYTLQARFALAAIYDQAAVAGDALE